jgi:hypothetical protein
MQSPESVTQLLVYWSNGDGKALDKLMPLVYDELHLLAGNCLRRQRQNHTLQPTALVNEAYLKLVSQRNARWQNRAQFFWSRSIDVSHSGRSCASVSDCQSRHGRA